MQLRVPAACAHLRGSAHELLDVHPTRLVVCAGREQANDDAGRTRGSGKQPRTAYGRRANEERSRWSARKEGLRRRRLRRAIGQIRCCGHVDWARRLSTEAQKALRAP